MPTITIANTFGALLKQLRHRMGMTQGELAALVGFSLSQISLLEKNKRQPDLQQLVERFIPALELNDQPQVAQRLLELAATARGEQLPSNLTLQFKATRTVEVSVSEEVVETSSLPALPVRVIGRQSAISSISKRLMEVPGRLLTLVGSPGVGKTTLAIAVSERVQPFFRDGVAFVALAPLTDPAQLPTLLSHTLGLEDSSAKPVQTRLVEFLRRKSMLLILDNFEHLLPAAHTPPSDSEPSAAKQIAQLLSECPALHILATSREPLRLRAEQRQPVLPLELDAAVTLFLERAEAVAPGFVLNESNQPLIETICRRLDGIPLAIELIAARADRFVPQQMLDWLEQQPLHTLSGDLHDLPERHRTLQSAIQHSHALLNPAEQRAFRSLSLFVGGFDQASATALGVAEPILRSLVKKSLVRSERSNRGEERFSLLETLRHFGLEQLSLLDEAYSQRLRHAEYFAEVAQQVFAGVRSETQEAWLRRAHNDHDNFRTALRFALEQQAGELAIAIAGGLWWFWYRQGFINEGRSWLAKSLESSSSLREPQKAATEEAKRQRANACNGAGSMASEQSDYTNALVYFQQAMAIYKELDDPDGIARILHNMALVARGQGNFAQALAWLQESSKLEQQSHTQQLADPLCLANIGVTLYEMDDLPAAERSLREAHQQVQHQQDAWTTAFIAGNLAEVLRVAGDLEQAAHFAQESLAGFLALGDHHYTPEPQLNLAQIALSRGDLGTARTLTDAVLSHYESMKDDHGIANVLQLQAQIVLCETDDHAGAIRAAQLLEQAITLRSQIARPLSIHEERERAALHTLIEQRIRLA